MDAARAAVGCAVAAVLAGHQLARLDGGRRAALWAAARAASSAPAGPAPGAPAAGERARGVAPAAPASAEEAIEPDRFGQFESVVEIDGRRLPALVDTGATFVSLGADDAERLGIRPAPSDFRYAVDTANGRAAVAKVRLASVRLGAIEVRDVTALVSGRGHLGRTLLGMSFLSRLSGVRIERGRLLLTR